MKNLRIVLISDSYPPEVRSASRLMYECSITMLEMGHAVTVLTTTPQYNLADNTETDFRTVEVEDGVKVVRIKTLPIHLVSMMLRGISVLSLPYSFVKAGKRFVDVYPQVILVYSPPLTLAIAGRLLAKQFNAKLVLNVQDLFPQNAIDLGAMTNPLIIKFFEWIEAYAYRSADYITVHSAGNLKMLTNDKHVPSQKTAVFYNWVNIPEPEPASEEKPDFRLEFGLNGKFIILFGGVIGPAQGLDVVISAAQELTDTNACFLLVGDGSEKKRLQNMAAQRSLTNIVFKPFVALDVYESLMKCADVGLVTLHKDMKTPVVPGKLVSFLSKKIPVIASLNPESDGRQIINEGRCGMVSAAGDGKALARNVRTMIENPGIMHEMGEHGYAYVKDNMNRNRIMDQYEQLFIELSMDSPPLKIADMQGVH